MKYPLLPLHLFTILALLFCHSSRAETVSIVDFGAKSGAETDSTPAFVKALEYAAAHPDCTIEIPKGKFYLQTACDPISIKPPSRWHLSASGLKGATIQGQGMDSEILFGQYAAGILLERCEGLTIRNLVFDYAFPLFSQGQVVGYSGSDHSLILKPDAGYPSPLTGPNTIFSTPYACWLTLHKKGMELAFFEALFAEKTEADGENVRYMISEEAAGKEFKAAMKQGKQAELIAGDRYVRVARDAGQLLRFNLCSDVTVENVSIYASSGFLILGWMCGDVTVRGCDIKPRPGSDRMIATCADGLHFVGGRGKYLIENNTFDSLEDDNINIVLRGGRIESSPQPNVLKLKPASDRYYAVGDRVRLYDCIRSTYTEYKVVGVDAAPHMARVMPWLYTLTMDRPVEGALVFASQEKDAMPTMIYNMSWSFGDVTIRNNKCLNNRAHGVRIAASGVTVENNYFDLSGFPSIFVHSTIRDNYFDEGLSFPSNVTIRNNTLKRGMNNGGCTGNDGAICVEIRDDGTQKLAEGCRLLENISIMGNRISDTGRAGIACSNARNLTIENNEIQNPNLLFKSSKDRAGILVKNSAHVTVKNNTVTGSNIGQPVLLDQVIETADK